MHFHYGQKEIDFLKKKDKRLAQVIDRVGFVEREVDPDLFSSVVHHIVGQQISSKAQATIWGRFERQFGRVDPETLAGLSVDEIQSLGMTFRKAGCVLDFARKVHCGAFDLKGISTLPDREAIQNLTLLKGVGVWTAEMILLFCLERPDILSFDDLAIRRGLRMLYRHREITRERFEAYRRRFSPCGSVASLYLWAVAGGAIPELTDPALPKPGKDPRNRRAL